MEAGLQSKGYQVKRIELISLPNLCHRLSTRNIHSGLECGNYQHFSNEIIKTITSTTRDKILISRHKNTDHICWSTPGVGENGAATLQNSTQDLHRQNIGNGKSIYTMVSSNKISLSTRLPGTTLPTNWHSRTSLKPNSRSKHIA